VIFACTVACKYYGGTSSMSQRWGLVHDLCKCI